MTKIFGALTVGQSPRPDILDDILKVLGPTYQVMESGALDGLTPAQIAALRPQPGEDVLVTRLAGGQIVQVAEQCLAPLVQARAKDLFAKGAALIALLCTGHFPDFPAPGTVIRPQVLINEAAAQQGRGRLVGVLCPAPEHIQQMQRRWGATLGKQPLVRAASPYLGAAGVEPAARELKRAGVELVVLDCIAYTLEIQQYVQRIVEVETLLPRLLTAQQIQRIMEG